LRVLIDSAGEYECTAGLRARVSEVPARVWPVYELL